MSSSPEAILYYGFPLPDYEDSDYSYHDINDAWEEKFRPKEPNDQSDYRTPEWDKWREEYKAWQASADNIKIAWSGAEGCEAYYVHAEGLKKSVDWGDQMEITSESLLVSEEFAKKPREFCERNGIEMWEYGGADTNAEFQLHVEAAQEVAKRIRAMSHRYYDRHLLEAKSAGNNGSEER